MADNKQCCAYNLYSHFIAVSGTLLEFAPSELEVGTGLRCGYKSLRRPLFEAGTHASGTRRARPAADYLRTISDGSPLAELNRIVAFMSSSVGLTKTISVASPSPSETVGNSMPQFCFGVAATK